MYKIEDITPGKSYGCRFRLTTKLDTDGKPSGSSDAPPKSPGVYEGFGIIQKRDLKNRLLEVYDTTARKMFRVDFESIWDVDDVEYVD